MGRKIFLMLLLAALVAQAAFAEVYEGTTAAMSEIPVICEAGGTMESMNVRAGQIVGEGDVVGNIQTYKTFAKSDGVVARIHSPDGVEADGAALEILPVEKFQIYCTVERAYEAPENMLVRSGEAVYIKCTVDGSHCGTGIVTMIDGAEYRVAATGGELYLGETVYIYRDEEFSTEERIGIGTVVSAEAEAYEASGSIVKMHVAEGEYVQRGELLFESAGSADAEIAAPAAGIVTRTLIDAGERAEKGQIIAYIATRDGICVEFYADETQAAEILPGDAAQIVFAWDNTETAREGVVSEVSHIAESGMYRVRVSPAECGEILLGMTAEVILQ